MGSGVPLLLVRNLRNIREIQNLRLSLSLTLTKEVDLLGPDWNLTRRPLLLTPVVSFCRGGEPLGLGGLLPSAPPLLLSALPPITSQHPPTIWKGPSLPSFPSPCNQLACRGHQSLKCGAGICLGACLAGCSRHCRTEQTGTWQVIVSKVKVASYHLGAYDQISYFCKSDQFLLTKE